MHVPLEVNPQMLKQFFVSLVCSWSHGVYNFAHKKNVKYAGERLEILNIEFETCLSSSE